jgi:hypothetical protein
MLMERVIRISQSILVFRYKKILLCYTQNNCAQRRILLSNFYIQNGLV